MLLERDGCRCVLCGRAAADGVELQVAHIVSVVAGAAAGIPDDQLNSDENLCAMCAACNLGYGGATLPLRLADAIFRARAAQVQP